MLRGFPPFSSDAYTTGVLLSIRRDCRRTRRSFFFSPFVWEKTPTLHYSCTTLQLFNSSGLGSGPPDRKSIRTMTAQRIPLYTTALNPKWCHCKMLIILVNQSWWGADMMPSPPASWFLLVRDDVSNFFPLSFLLLFEKFSLPSHKWWIAYSILSDPLSNDGWKMQGPVKGEPYLQQQERKEKKYFSWDDVTWFVWTWRPPTVSSLLRKIGVALKRVKKAGAYFLHFFIEQRERKQQTGRVTYSDLPLNDSIGIEPGHWGRDNEEEEEETADAVGPTARSLRSSYSLLLIS